MIFFGWGKKTKAWKIDDEKHLLAVWSYFHIFWCPIMTGVQWHIVGDKRSEDVVISYEQLKGMFPENTPKLNIWDRFGLLLVIGALIIISIISSL